MANSIIVRKNKNHRLRNSEIETISLVLFDYLTNLKPECLWLAEFKKKLIEINLYNYYGLTIINLDELIPKENDEDFVLVLKNFKSHLKSFGSAVSKEYLNSFYEKGIADRAGYTSDLPITFFEKHIDNIIDLYK